MNILHPIFGIGKKMFSGYDIPPQEVAELYKLYTQTGGPNWINHTNWFTNKICATWYGLTVAGGRVTKIELYSNGLAGMTGFSLKPFTALTYFASYGVLNATLAIQIQLADISRSLTYIRTSQTATVLLGTLSDAPSTTQHVSVYETPSLIFGGTTPVAAVGLRSLSIKQTSATQASKDSIIERIYADRALFTYATHSLDVSVGPALTGVYQTSAAPSTPAEKAYALVNDQNAEGFLKWAITL